MMRLLAVATLALCAAMPAHAAEGKRIEIKGELIDTWCYFSGVMGGPESVVGTAHHTCAMWCAAGGIPVGLLAEDGEVYMVLKLAGDDESNGGDTFLTMNNDTIVAEGMHYARDGINYLVVSEVIANEGIPNHTHEDFGVTPGNTIPDSVVDKVLEDG